MQEKVRRTENAVRPSWMDGVFIWGGLDYMFARYYSSGLARFMAVDPGDDTALGNPQTWNKYVYVRNNPLIAIDPNGRDTYLVNRCFSSESCGALPSTAWISHTFIVTTDSKGNIEHTYSWGNDPDPKNSNIEGKWFADESEDVAAAEEALKSGKVRRVGDDSLDPFVDEAFRRHADNEHDPSNHGNWLICNNCKTEARKLIDEAKAMRAEAEKKRSNSSSRTGDGHMGNDSRMPLTAKEELKRDREAARNQ